MSVDWDEATQRWMSRSPIEGVAFFLGDPVRVISGPHANACGESISLLDVEPTPLYLVELADGTDVRMHQHELVGTSAQDPGLALMRLQRWYSSQCDGEWEHQSGVMIETLDNPGWQLTVDLEGTPLESAAFSEVSELEEERYWIHCKVENSVFSGAGGPHMLSEIIEVFLRWAEGQNPAGRDS